jgi:hypothetical protein
MWASGHGADSVARAAYGYEPTREAATAVANSSLTAKSHPGAWKPGGFSGELPAGIPVPFTL